MKEIQAYVWLLFIHLFFLKVLEQLKDIFNVDLAVNSNMPGFKRIAYDFMTLIGQIDL